MFWLRSWLCGLITLHFSLPSIASLKLNHADNWSLIQENAGIKSWRFGIFMHGTVSEKRSDSIQWGSQSIKSMWIFASSTKSIYLLGFDQFQLTFYLILKSFIFCLLFHHLHVHLCVRKIFLRICLIICVINNILSKLFNNILKLCERRRAFLVKVYEWLKRIKRTFERYSW